MSDATIQIEKFWNLRMACVQLSVSGLKCLKVHLLYMVVINSLLLMQCLIDIMPLWPILFLLWDYHYVYVLYVCLWHTGVECMNLCIWIVSNSYLNCWFPIMGRNLPLFLWAACENLLISTMQVCKIWSSVIRMMSVQWIERTWKLLWHTLIYCLRICWEGLKKTAVRLVGHQDWSSTSWTWRSSHTWLWCLV